MRKATKNRRADVYGMPVRLRGSPDWWISLFIVLIVRKPQVGLEVWLSDTDKTKPPKVAASLLQSLTVKIIFLCRSETHSAHCL